jgi:uncharacterized membrane protein (UPF0127 family)
LKQSKKTLGLEVFGIVIAALMLGVTIAASASGPRVAIDAPDGSERALVRVEIADTPATRERGLMFHAHLDPDAGMIFIFPKPDHLEFWMKNTPIPLDMIFADKARKIVGIVAEAEPLSEKAVGVDTDSQYVLEVNGGFCKQHHVAAGDRLNFMGFTPHAQQ